MSPCWSGFGRFIVDKTAWGFSIMGDIGCKIVRCVCERVSACVCVCVSKWSAE